jgi:hypothetical protein
MGATFFYKIKSLLQECIHWQAIFCEPSKDPTKTLHPRITLDNRKGKNCTQVLIGHTYIGGIHAKLLVPRRH